MARFSANLGFLWQELDLCNAIEAAAHAGFDAVECHWPYAVAAADVAATLTGSKLRMLGLNTRPGDKDAGDFGLAAVPGREQEARRYIDEAVSYASDIDCVAVHVMAGKTGASKEADRTYRDNLHYACEKAAAHGITILMEPINHRDAPGYHLGTVEAAIDIIEDAGHANLKVMFDCYHTQIMQGDILTRLSRSLPHIGHIQIAAVPDRGEPDAGELNYPEILDGLDAMGYEGFVGAEYRPRRSTAEGLGWLQRFRGSR